MGLETPVTASLQSGGSEVHLMAGTKGLLLAAERGCGCAGPLDHANRAQAARPGLAPLQLHQPVLQSDCPLVRQPAN